MVSNWCLACVDVKLVERITCIHGRPSWGDEERCVNEILEFQGESLEILYNVMQRPVSHDQKAYTAQQTLKNRNTGLHLFTMRHAHLLEIRKLKLTVKKPCLYRC